MNAAVKQAPQAIAMSETQLVRQHADLVKRIAHHMMARLPASVDVDDLVQAGIIGLLEAARGFDGTRGACFETYAGIRIRGAMVDELRRTDWAPRSVHRRMREVSQAMRAIEQATGREARDSQIAAHMNLTLSEYHEIVQDAARCQVLSMDAHDEDEDGIEGVEADGTPLDHLQRSEFQSRLAAAIRGLPERERLVMSLYYEQELNLREIGAVLEVSESRVCQIHGQALLRLRAKLSDWTAAGAAA